jgi:CBS domain-containing protein
VRARAQASQKMLRHHINSLPVVEGTKVVGVVTRHDVLRALIATHSPLLE